MAKVRIYELAKKLGLSNKEVMDLFDKNFGIKVKSHSSTVEESEAEKLEKTISSKVSSAPKPEMPSDNRPAAMPVESKKTPIMPKQTPPAHVKKDDVATPKREPHGEPRSPQNRQVFRPQEQGRREDFRQRPQGQGPQGQGPRYQGQGQREDFRQRSQGQGPQGQGPRYQGQGQREDFRQRPQGQGPQGQGPRYQGQGQREDFRQRPQGQGPQGQGPRFQGQGQRPQGQGPRFQGQGQRPQGQGPREDFKQKPQAGLSQPVAIGDAPLTKGAPRKDTSTKKKGKLGKDDIFTKEEKLEQAKFLQESLKKKKKFGEEQKEKVTEVVIDKPITVGELASSLEVSAAEIVKELMMSGILATVNQVIDIDTAKNVSEKLGFTVLAEKKQVEEKIEEAKIIDESKLKHRAPVVTIMGHVDHGKTTLLDAIRATKHKIVSGEVGGITQSIGAYSVKIDDKKIVFIDTPGHEAFTAMRARGAKATDIAILVVAADDGIMPQTIEAINHAKAAKVPIIVAVNKIDKPAADPDRVLQQLTEYDLVPEKWGGETVCVPVSALQGTNLDELLEYILLVAEVENLKANPDEPASGVIIEAKLDKGKGAVATLLVQAGSLKVGDCIVAGPMGGKVRALISDEGERIKKAGPSTPVEVLGLTEVPQAGDHFEVVENEKTMKSMIEERKYKDKESRLESMAPAQVRTELLSQKQDETKDLNIIIKANTHGSAEALSASLQQLVSKQIYVKIVHIGVGDISEADVMLASASNAIIIGFSVREDVNAARVAQSEGVDIRKYDIIYQALEDIEKTMLGLLSPEMKEVDLGVAEVRQIFTIGKTTKIAGCYVLDGKIVRNKIAKVERNGKEIFKGSIDQLKRFKDDVKEVAQGYECGISFHKFNDLQEGDIIKVSTMEEIERETLV